MTLLERRKAFLATELDWLMADAARLRAAIESEVDDPHGMAMLTAVLLQHAQRAAHYARLVEDLSDIEKYGPGGGR